MISLRTLRNGSTAAAAAAGLAANCLTLPAWSAPLKTDTTKSTVGIIFKQLNVPVEAKFAKFTSQIDFDSAKLEAAKATIDVTIASFDLGEQEYNQEVQKKNWFDAAHFPKATFVAGTIKPSAPGKYEVAGKLTIKGKTGDVQFPLTVKKEGAAQTFDGALAIKRLAYNIGEGEWKDTSMVADEVIIKFHIVTVPAP
jgi:polyisoprenoid-binding protein YceI